MTSSDVAALLFVLGVATVAAGMAAALGLGAGLLTLGLGLIWIARLLVRSSAEPTDKRPLA